MGWSEKYKKSINCDNPKGFSQRAHCQGRKKKMQEAKEQGKDHEVSMAQTQLKKSEENIRKLRKALGKKERDIPAWVQAKITDTEHNTDAAASYMGEEKTKCGEGKYWCKTDKKCKSLPKGHHVMPNGDLMKDDEHEESGDVSEATRDGKSAKDPGYSLRDWFKGDGWVQVSGKYKGKPCAKQPGQITKPFCRDADDAAAMSKDEKERRTAKKRREDPDAERSGKAQMVSASYSNWRVELDQLHEKKDACYHKVKSRYKIWPSAYASGALVKCRKVGAANWGNSTNEDYDYSNWKDDFNPIEIETIDLIKADPLVVKEEQLDEVVGLLARLAAKGALKLAKPVAKAAGKFVDKQIASVTAKSVAKAKPTVGGTKITYKPSKSTVQYGGGSTTKPTQPKLTRDQAQKALDDDPWTIGAISRDDVMRVRQDRRTLNNGYEYSDWRSELSEDWQKVNRQDKTDGLSQAAVDAYRRENPGSKLQTAVTEKKPTGKRAKRRANFCRRMKGMKDKLTSEKTARDPDSRINKALRRWRCN